MTLRPHNHNMWAVIGVYGGDFFRVERSEWEPEGLEERPYDLERNVRLLEASGAGAGGMDPLRKDASGG